MRGPHRALERRIASLAILAALLAVPAVVGAQDQYIVLGGNDLGMHCMNRNHATLSVLPPYSTLLAQVLRRGDASRLPELVTTGVTLEYSVPGNTYSAGKTDFWDHVQQLYGVALPPDVGLTGNGLSGQFELRGDLYVAEGIPLTPFTDARPTVEDPYQQALVVLRGAGGTELARSHPVVPVSTEMNCASTNCHTSEQQILQMHENEGGFDPTATPILCADCHGSPPLTGTDPGPAGWFSLAMHGQHSFIDSQIPGQDGCYRCHPGPQTLCLRGTMANDFGMECQDCHGGLAQVASSIEAGRTPWLEEPACRTCHTSTYGEPAGQLYRESRGHGGLLCSACHGSPHAIFPTRVDRDNADIVALQGHAGILSDCTVCHGTTPAGPGPHGVVATGVVEQEVLGVLERLLVYPAPAQAGVGCTVMARGRPLGDGHLLVFDARGRTIRRLDAVGGGGGVLWDGRDRAGVPVASGVYFLRWESGARRVAGKVVMIE